MRTHAHPHGVLRASRPARIVQLGHSEASPRPERVDALRNVACITVACGHHATCALDTEGGAFMWGALSGSGSEAPVQQERVHRLTLPSGNSVRTVSLGGRHALAVTTEGSLFSWGAGPCV